jgi:aspartate ammonia-lyase
MPNLDTLLEETAIATGIAVEDLHALLDRGTRRTYAPGAWLFHESTPRQWAGMIEEGEINIVRGLHGATTHIGTLGAGTMIGEGALLDDTPHSTGAFTRYGATVIEVPRQVWEELRQRRPDIFYRIVARVAQRISERLRYASAQLAGISGPDQLLGRIRKEHDLLGERELPDHVYYGVQTLRGLENFPLSGVPLKNFDHFVDALAYVKKAAALANYELNVLTAERKDAICAACDEILAGHLHDQFVIDMMQGGAGTSTNMNANEVIANRGLEIMGYAKGDYQHLHPNDDVNCSQSANDAYPTAIKMAVILSLQDTLAGMEELKTALEAKAEAFADILKMGRTENQDAVPMTLGQEFGGSSQSRHFSGLTSLHFSRTSHGS